MSTHYQLWVHRGSGAAYAVRMRIPEKERVPIINGIYGPLDRRETPTRAELAGYAYQMDTALQTPLDRRAEFQVFLPRP